MKPHLTYLTTSLLLPLLLNACTTQLKYPDEPAHYVISESSISVPYLALAFPSGNPTELALQLALVKYKNQAAAQERWLLLHHIPYQWMLVDWQGDEYYLLAAGPYQVGNELASQRLRIQQGLAVSLAMPAVATYTAEELTAISSSVAKRTTELDFLPMKPVPSDHSGFRPSR
jgi:hypothetical protein